MTPTEAIYQLRIALEIAVSPNLGDTLEQMDNRKAFYLPAFAALSVLEASVLPEGYVAAPLEPTKEMIERAAYPYRSGNSSEFTEIFHKTIAEYYRAMLAAIKR